MKIQHFKSDAKQELFGEVRFDQNTDTQYFRTNTYYFLIEGTLDVYSDHVKAYTLSSNYDSAEFEDYKDVWIYDTEYTLDLTNSSKLVAFTPEEPINVKVLKLENNTVTVNTNDNSTVLVCGSPHSFNGGNTIPMQVMVYKTNLGSQTVSTEGLCHVIYIEPK
jgi:hypothetical protein